MAAISLPRGNALSGAPARLARAVRTEAGLFRLAIALIAVHLVDDNFVHPAAGTTAADHLASGLIPLGALALAAWAHPRLRGGRPRRAQRRARDPRRRRRDPAGPLRQPGRRLGQRLHRPARPPGGRAPARARRRHAVADAPHAGQPPVALPAPRAARRRRRARRRRACLPGRARLRHHPRRPRRRAGSHLGAAYEDVQFETSDGLTLRGWYVPSRNGAAVIAFPGRKGPQRQARMLARHGYGVLLFDRRGEGASDGEPNTWGWGGDRDVKAAIDYLQHRPDVDPDRIGGLGRSVGGEMMIETAAETSDLKAVVSDGAGARSYREELDNLEGGPVDKVLGTVMSVAKSASRRGLLQRAAAAAPEGPRGTGRPAPAAAHRRARQRRRRGAQPRLPRGGRPDLGAVGDPGNRPHAGGQEAPGRVRAAHRRLLRSGPAAMMCRT